MPDTDRINKLFKALADPTRRQVLHALVVASTALSLTQLSDQFDITRQGVTKHVKLLQESGLVRMQPQGRERYLTVDLTVLSDLKDWLAFYDKFWDGKLANLGKFLEEEGQ